MGAPYLGPVFFYGLPVMPTPSILYVKDFGAVGDGCNDDTAAIQDALDVLQRLDDTPPASECGTGGDVWTPWAVAVYFPAGLYRITSPLRPPKSRYYRLFGDGGRGGSFYGTGVPLGTVLRQDTDDQPILLFERDSSFGFTIERLGFTWKNAQEMPEEPPGDEAFPPGAVGILFSYAPLSQPPPDRAGYFHVLIKECWFRRGWRGIALDYRTASQGGPGISLSLWNTQVEHCGFEGMSGAAVWLRDVVGKAGMPGNAYRSLFVVNDPERQNGEPQLELIPQGECTLDGLDLEGSHFAPVLRLGGQMSIRNVHLEHLEIHQEDFRVIWLSGNDAVTLDGLLVDGVLDAQRSLYPNSFGSIVHSDNVSLVLSGARGPRGDSQVSGGLVLPDGDVYLVTGSEHTQIQLSGRPYFANRTTDTYFVHLWGENEFGNSPGGNVQAEPARAPVTLTGASLAPGARATYSVAVPWARRGDVVALGAPPTLPPEVLFAGVVVTDGAVQIRMFNTAAAGAGLPADVSGTWYVTAGNGPRAGEPRFQHEYL
jgi:hypothetical protein